VLSPILLGRLARVHPVVVFLSIVFWGWLWGPIGTFLAVPIVTAIKTIADLVPGAATVSALLADADPDEPVALDEADADAAETVVFASHPDAAQLVDAH